MPRATPARAGYHFVRGHTPLRTPGVILAVISIDLVGPLFVSGEEGNQSNAIVSVTFNEQLVAVDYAAGVTIKLDGVTATITNATLQSNQETVYYTLASPWGAANTVVTFAYSDTLGDYADLNGNQMGDITTQAIVNNVGIHWRFNDAPNSWHYAWM